MSNAKQEMSFESGDGSIKHVPLAAWCVCDAVVVANEGTVDFVIEVRDGSSKATTKTRTIRFARDEGRSDLAVELAARLKKGKRVTVWVSVDGKKLQPTFIEVEEGVRYKIDGSK